jgi:hypothetical protein
MSHPSDGFAKRPGRQLLIVARRLDRCGTQQLGLGYDTDRIAVIQNHHPTGGRPGGGGRGRHDPCDRTAGGGSLKLMQIEAIEHAQRTGPTIADRGDLAAPEGVVEHATLVGTAHDDQLGFRPVLQVVPQRIQAVGRAGDDQVRSPPRAAGWVPRSRPAAIQSPEPARIASASGSSSRSQRASARATAGWAK